MKYSKSKNYELLYDLVIQGNEIPCWVYEQSKKTITVVRLANLINESKYVSILSGYLGGGGFITMDSKNKKLFIQQCQDNALEWLLPVNAEICNDKGELEYQIALIPFVLKRMVTWCPIVLELWRNNIKFYYKGTDKIISQEYGDYSYFLKNQLHWYNHNQETALIEALDILKHIKQQNNE